MLSCPIINVNKKLQEYNPGRIKKDMNSSGMKVYSSRKSAKTDQVLTKGGGNRERVAEKDIYKNQSIPCDMLQTGL